MARAISKKNKIINSLIAWTIGLIIFFPILWIIILSFKTEGDAIRSPIAVIFSNWTFENYFVVQDRSDYFKHFYNSVFIAFGSTFLGNLFGHAIYAQNQ